MMKKIIFSQRGRNPDYPMNTEVWSSDYDEIPEWLSDVSKVKAIDQHGSVYLDLKPTNTGGFAIQRADNQGYVVKTVNSDDYVCRDPKSGRIFSLTRNQFYLLYSE